MIVDARRPRLVLRLRQSVVGELDPSTGKVAITRCRRCTSEQPKGPLDVEFDPDGNVWVGLSYQAGAAKIDRKTKTGHHLSAAAASGQVITTQTNMVTPTHMYVDNKVWMEDTENGHVYPARPRAPASGRLKGQATTGRRQDHPRLRPAGRQGQQPLSDVVRRHSDRPLDAKTNVAKIWSTPFARSRPRRGRFDDQNRLWFAEYAAQPHRHVRSDDREDQGMEAADATGAPLRRRPDQGRAEVWTGSMMNDQVARLNPKTDESVEYLLPHTTNIRRVFVQEAARDPVLWVGNNHGNAIVKVEPLD